MLGKTSARQAADIFNVRLRVLSRRNIYFLLNDTVIDNVAKGRLNVIALNHYKI